MTAGKTARRRGRAWCRDLARSAASTASPEPGPPAAAETPREDPMHGYTVADIDRIARGAARANGWAASDFTDRMETAWDAAAVFILTAAGRPEPRDVAIAARRAVLDAITDGLRYWGYAGTDPAAGPGSAPRYWAYWFRPPGDPADERITDRIAAAQIWAALAEDDRVILTARMASASRDETFALAAAALGITPATCQARLTRARRAFAGLWHAPDAPPSAPKHPDRCPARTPHQLVPEAPCGTLTAYNRHRRRGEPADPACVEGARAERRARRKTRGVTVHLRVTDGGATACGYSTASGALPATTSPAEVTCGVCTARNAAAVRRREKKGSR
jgi:hypothetical protein